MSNYYTGVLALTILNMVIMCLITSANHTMKKSMKARFIAAFVVVIVGAVYEWGAVYLQENSSMVWLHTLVKTVELCVAPAIPLVLFPAICKNRPINIAMAWIVAINMVIEVLSAFFGFVFYVDAANVYHHGPLYFLYMVSYGLEGVLLAFGAILTLKEYQSRSARLIIFEIIFVFFGIALQMVDKSIRVDYIAISIVLSFFYVEYQDVIQSADSLTKLLNRHSYDNKIGSLDGDMVIVNIDIDYFKQCNDNFGHLYGDKCLTIVASVIMEVMSKYGSCYRIGGDEFCVILSNKVLPDSILSKLHLTMGERRLTEPGLPTISTGYAYYKHGKESIIDAIEKADSMMYKFKKIRKENMAQGNDLPYMDLQRLVLAN